MANEKILLVEDEELMRDILTRLLQKEGYQIYPAADGKSAEKVFQQEDIGLVITDIQMPGMNGLELLARVKDIDPEAMVITITAYSSVETAVEAMRKGAYDYITKPFINDDIKITVKNALNQRQLFRENRWLKRELKEKYRFENIIGKSEAMQRVYDMMEKVSLTPSNLLITGESGTGKELVAKAIHLNSDRADKPFLAINCGALAQNLLESELFGYVKGAFTGALTNKVGLFKAGDGGTLFLDEVSELTPSLQVKLLRAIQEREVIPVGGTKPEKFDVRFIFATNKNLESLVEAGVFREDLYYRINVVTIEMPPLRNRRDDIPLLANHFLAIYSKRFKKEGLKLSKDCMKLLINYHWPGNVRELENVIERAVTLTDKNLIEAEDLPEKIRRTRIFIEDVERGMFTLEELEKQHILRVMDEVDGDKARAAEILGINLSTLYRKLEKYNKMASLPLHFAK